MDTESFRVAILIEVRVLASISLHSEDGAAVIPKRRELTRRVNGIINLVRLVSMTNVPNESR